MNRYFAIFKIRTKSLFQYRTAAFAGICTQLFWGIISLMIFRAFYKETFTVEPLSLTQTITFIWLGQALLGILPWNIDKEIEAKIKNGNVIYDLVRPLNLFGMWFSRALAMRCTPILIRSIPIFIFGNRLGLKLPVSFDAGFFFLISIFLAIFLSSAITTLIMISLFWSISGEGIQRLLPHMTVLLSGMVVPLPLFPSWMQHFLNFQPFRGILDIPCRIYTGVISSADALFYLGFQIAWISGFIILGHGLIHKAHKKLIVHGG